MRPRLPVIELMSDPWYVRLSSPTRIGTSRSVRLESFTYCVRTGVTFDVARAPSAARLPARAQFLILLFLLLLILFLIVLVIFLFLF